MVLCVSISIAAMNALRAAWWATTRGSNIGQTKKPAAKPLALAPWRNAMLRARLLLAKRVSDGDGFSCRDRKHRILTSAYIVCINNAAQKRICWFIAAAAFFAATCGYHLCYMRISSAALIAVFSLHMDRA